MRRAREEGGASAALSSTPSSFPMLTSARQRAQRARFGQLIATMQAAHAHDAGGVDTRVPGPHARAFDSDRTAAAGAFGCLDPDMACLLLSSLLRADGDPPVSESLEGACPAETSDGTGVDLGDRAPPAPHEVVLAAGRDAANLAQTCHFLDACMRLHGHTLRLEMAAARCTSFAPSLTLPASSTSLQNAPFAAPWFAQCIREERSRFDVQMLESALVAMVPHCAGEHCRSVRRAHNLNLLNAHRACNLRPSSAEYLDQRQQSQLRSIMLGTQRPCVKVVHDALVSGHAHAARADCLISTEKNGQVHLAVMSDETPDALDPHTQLRCRWSADLPSISDQERVCHHIAISECGKWVAVVQRRTGPVSTYKTFPDSHVTLWEVGSSLGGGGARSPHVSQRLCDTLVQSLWFRTCNLDARDAADGVARTNATILCFYASMRYPLTMRSSCWGTVGRLTSGQALPCTTQVHQFCVEDGSFTNVKLTDRGQLAWWFGHLLRPAGLDAKLPVHGQDACDNWGNNVVANAVEDETAIISLAASTCADSTAACIFGIAQFSGLRHFAVAQAVVLDLSYRHRNHADVVMARSVTPMMSVTGDIESASFARIPRRVYIGPRGDLVVVLCGRPMQGASVDFELQVFRRQGRQERHFTFLATVPLNQSIHHFRNERHLTNALWDDAPGPARRINVTQPPISSAFSPCGRFLLLGFATGLQSVALANQTQAPGVHAQVAAPVHANGGVCVLDLSEIWERPPIREATERPTRTVAWIECMNSLVPFRMHWTVAGIWIDTSRGALLLGMINGTPVEPGVLE